MDIHLYFSLLFFFENHLVYHIEYKRSYHMYWSKVSIYQDHDNH